MKIVSGGQTGVDRAALDVAMALGLASGGWCPAGRRAEDGPIAARYPLQETPSADSAQRTEWNVRDSDATLVLARGPLTGGTEATIGHAERLSKPCLVREPCPGELAGTMLWLTAERPRVLNVAGPRESEEPGIHAAAEEFLRSLLTAETMAEPAGG